MWTLRAEVEALRESQRNVWGEAQRNVGGEATPTHSERPPEGVTNTPLAASAPYVVSMLDIHDVSTA